MNHLQTFLGQQVKSLPWPLPYSTPSAVLAWGRKPSASWAAVWAAIRGMPITYLEDAFVRSYQPSAAQPALSLVVDELGVHYDCTRPSQLETLLNSSQDVSVPMQEEALHFLLQHRLSKYNHAPFDSGLLQGCAPHNDRHGERSEAILVIDQTLGDLSVTYGAANADTFQTMLQAALADNPGATIYVKTHPQTSSGDKRGYLTQVPAHPRVVLLTQPINPIQLLEAMDKVYVVSSTMGFEALLLKKPVVCFGMPWYAGWGVTDDRCTHSPAATRRTRQRQVSELFAAAYLRYARYIHPFNHQRGSLMDVLPWLQLQQQTAQRWHGPLLNQRWVLVGMRGWKRRQLRQFWGLHPELVTFDVPPQAGDQVLCWGAKAPQGAWRVEDGFVRSVGLGSDLIPPMSLVLDKRGIYFDPSRPSDLEHLLEHHLFTPKEVAEAQAVRHVMVEHGITKYNLEPLQTVVWPSAGRRVLLVPGQVEDDDSVRLGCTDIHTNLGLLQAVRQAHPQAFIVYKPHPDVVTGNRAGRVASAQALQWADHVETQASVVSCIQACDELHTLTSLSGFDALLRGKPVTTYGLPFYAGWGLTTDMAGAHPCFERRTRRLSLDELVAGALLLYPIYWDYTLKGVTTCMSTLLFIGQQRDRLHAQGRLDQLKNGFWWRYFRKLKHLTIGPYH